MPPALRPDPIALDAAIGASEARITARARLAATRRSRLPLRVWRQQAHLTAPAQGDLARKAMHAGTAGMPRILQRFGLEPAELADRLDDPIAGEARARVVAVAAGAEVPAIVGMTLDFPVSDPALEPAADRERFLARMALVYGDAVRARGFGMVGKWVGHPAQLFAVLLAYDAGMTDSGLEQAPTTLSSYRHAVERDGVGATIIDGAMADRATDRHARQLLRRAVAAGRFDPRRALELGVITPDELAEALRLAPEGRDDA